MCNNRQTKHQSPHCRPEPNAGSSKRQGFKGRTQQQQQQQALHAAFPPAASVASVPSANRLVLGRPLDAVLNLGVQRDRAGLAQSAPTLMDHSQQYKSAAQVSSGSLLTPAAVSMQAKDGPSTSAVPAAVADPALAAGPPPADTPMLLAVPLLVFLTLQCLCRVLLDRGC